jgi:N-acyl amino acid synthase of PEP-CTERM/exosortase system
MQLHHSQSAFCLETNPPDQEPLTLYDLYMSTFEAVVSDTDALREECFRLRYQVYCIENEGYEPPTAFADRMERDAFDAHSVHALLRHRASGDFIGTVRLILHPGGATPRNLPIDQICAHNSIELPRAVTLGDVAELSRFCIAKKLRRRVLDNIHTGASKAEDHARMIPAMSLGLIRACYLLTRLNGVREWCMVMEPRLIEFLGKLGIHFNLIGPLIEFHGKRHVCHMNVDRMMARMKRERPDVWDVIADKGRYCALPMPSTPVGRKAADKTRRLKASA